MRIVFLNGPPGCGKDTAGDQMANRHGHALLKFADPLKNSVCGMLSISRDELERIKDRPHPALNGETPRKFLIRLSEQLIKPTYGDQFFGKVAVGKIDRMGDQFVHFTDSGFLSEAIPVVNAIGITNCLKVEIYREGKDFSNDSRSYWHMEGLRTIKMQNDGRIDQLGEKLFGIMSNVWGCAR